MNDSLEKYFEDGFLKSYILNNSEDPWKGTVLEGYYCLAQGQKGVFGESLVSKIMEKKGSEVLPKNNVGHDRLIDGYKTEIKLSFVASRDTFLFNHIAVHKDWERIIFLSTNTAHTFHMYWLYKEDFLRCIELNLLFKRQQGGIHGPNDDYKFEGKTSILENQKYLKKIDTWFIDGKKKIGIENWL